MNDVFLLIRRTRLALWVIGIIGLGVVPTACTNLSAQVAPENQHVQALRGSSDCAPIILGMGFGTVTVEGALAKKAPLISNYNEPHVPITKVRSVSLHDFQFLFFGARCVEIVGE